MGVQSRAGVNSSEPGVQSRSLYFEIFLRLSNCVKRFQETECDSELPALNSVLCILKKNPMVDLAYFRKLSLSFVDTVEMPHFEKISFRANKKIFATYNAQKDLACLMLSPIDQSVFCAYDKAIIYPVPNKWGLKGATFVELKKVRKDLFKDALKAAYNKAIATK